MEFATDVEGGHVFLNIELVSHVGRVEDEVEGEGPGLGPILVLRTYEFLSAELQGVVFLIGAVRKSEDLSTEGRCP